MNLDLSKTCIIGDTHFTDDILYHIERSDQFNSVKEADEHILNEVNSLSKGRCDDPCDTIIIAGDFGSPDFVGQLKYKNKILVLGNHDLELGPTTKWMQAGFDVVTDSLIVNEHILVTHRPPMYFKEHTNMMYVYAHVHCTPMYQTFAPHAACVSACRLNYNPTRLNRLVDKITTVTLSYYR